MCIFSAVPYYTTYLVAGRVAACRSMGGGHTGAPLIRQCEQKCDRPDQNINFAPNYFGLLLGGGAAS